MERVSLFLYVVMFAGCGGGSPSHVSMTEQDYLAIIDREGHQRVIPSDEFTDASTGEPTASKVLAIDRRSGKTAWVPVEDLYGQSPAMARYIPVTHADPDTFTNK